MSNLVETVLVRSDALSVSDKITYAVEQGGQDITVQSFGASASSPSNHVYSVQVPSVQTIMSRNVKWRCRVAYTVSGQVPPAGYLIRYGVNVCLAPFPLNQSCLTATANINNSSFSVNTREILDPLLRQCDRDKLGLWQATTPTQLDSVVPYSDATAAFPNSPFQGYNQAFNKDDIPRGAFRIVSIAGNAVNNTGAAVAGSAIITVDLSEPLVGLSPFTWGENPDEACGMNQLSQVNIAMSMDSLAQRSLRFIQGTAGLGSNLTISNVQYSGCYVDVEFQTPSPQCFLAPTTSLPYMAITNYQTPAQAAVPYQSSSDITSNTITLSSIPDRVLLFVREQQGLLDPSDADAYGAISSVSILFNNRSGILANAPASMLWKYSRDSGSKQNWAEFSGVANLPQLAAPGTTLQQTNTCGSVLALDFSRVIPTTGLQTCGSLGQYNFSVKVSFTNTTGVQMDAPILNVCMLSSGVVMLNQGTAQSFVGVLDEQTVLDAFNTKPTPSAELRRMVGGGFFDRLKTIAHKAYTFGRHHGPAALELARRHGVIDEAKHRLAQHGAVGKRAANAISALGYGVGEDNASGGRRLKHRLY